MADLHEDNEQLNPDVREALRTRRQIETNDPTLEMLEMGDDGYLPPDGVWARDGYSLGKNTCIKELIIWGADDIIEEDFEEFLRGFSSNRSTIKLSFCGCNLFEGNAFRILTQYFIENEALEYLGIISCYLGPDGVGVRSLSTALTKFNSLEEFECSSMNDDEVCLLLQALSGHTDLMLLSMFANSLGANACRSLATLLQNPRSQVVVLHLVDNQIDDEGASMIACGMFQNCVLRDVDLKKNPRITATGWLAILSALQNSTSRIEKLSLCENSINGAATLCLANTLTRRETGLKTLNLSNLELDGGRMIITGWLALFQWMQNSTLEVLDLSGNMLQDKETNYLSSSLARNRSLRKLKISNNRGVSHDGWQSFFRQVLQKPHSVLTGIDLSSNGFIDATIASLMSALFNNTKLKQLNLANNEQVSSTGWRILMSILNKNGIQCSNSVLEKLNLHGNIIDDGTMICLASSLVKNYKLRELEINCRIQFGIPPNRLAQRQMIGVHSLTLGRNITAQGWSAFSQLLRDTSSINATFESNHTLERLHQNEDEMPQDLQSLLHLNRKKSKSQVARLKIIQTYFREGFIRTPLIDMKRSLLPHVIAWISKDGQYDTIDNHFYGFLRSVMPVLLGHAKIKKRRRENS